MALPKRKVFMMIGSSNMEGRLAKLSDVPAADFTRWTGATVPPAAPTQSFQRPYHITVPGIRFYTMRLPYSLNLRRLVAAGSTDTVINYTDGDADTRQDSWVYIPETVPGNPTAQGQVRRILAQGASQLTVTAAFSPAPQVNDSIVILQDSHTISAAAQVFRATLPGFENSPLTKITTTGNSQPFTIADVGRFIMFPEAIEGAGPPPATGPETQFYNAKIIEFIDADEVVLDRDVPAAVAAAGKMIVVCAGANAVQTLATMQPPNAVMQDMTFFIDEKAPVYLTGLDYYNYVGMPWPAPKVPGGIRPNDPPQINCIPELTWRLRQLSNTPIDCISLAIGGTLISPGARHAPTFAPQGVPTAGQAAHFACSWLYDTHGIDWSPGGDSNLYVALVNTITGIRTLLLAEGLEPDFDCTFINLADNDQGDEQRQKRIGENHRILRDALRVATGNPRMKFIMAGPSTYGAITNWGGDVRDSTYAQLRQVAEDDAYTAYIDTRNSLYGKAFDGEHYSAAGQIQLGKDFFTAFEAVTKRANDAARLQAELPTLASLRTRVRRRYERSDVGNDATNTQIDMFLNDSIREFYNTLGDEKAWFLRRIEEVDVAAGLYPNTVTLPRTVKRLLRIESQSCPGRSLVWKGIGHTDEGRTQVSIHNAVSGPLLLHFIALTKDLVADTDTAVIPEEYVELVVILTCKRLTECAGNITMAAYYAAEAERLWRVTKRSCQLHDRMRQGQMEALNTYDATTNSAWPGGDEWGL